ncbi:MAG: ABC transporter permease [Actinomycetota bacterium]
MLGRAWAVAAKEFWSLLRQPQLLVLLLVGPVLIMAAFAISFRSSNPKPSVVVVVEPGSEGEEIFGRYRELFVSRTKFRGTVESVDAADDLIRSGQIDGAIILPAEPSEAIRKDERATIGVHYSTINPIFGLTVPNRARGLLFDLNDAMVMEGISRQLEEANAAREQVDALDARVDAARAASRALTGDEARRTTAELSESLNALETSLRSIQETAPEERRGEIGDSLRQIQDAQEAVSAIREIQEGEEIQEELARLDASVEALQETLSKVPDASPSVLTNPFRLDLENLAPFQPDIAGFYAPGTLAILIQHVSISLASLSIVRERMSGAYEFFEVSPLSFGQLLLGKFAAYLLVVLTVNAAVAAVMVGPLDVPLNGDPAPFVIAMALLTVSSLGIGFAVSALARSQLQAIQVAMLWLIASGFFSGFLFPLSEMAQPAHAISYFLPATYGIGAFQDVMIRGEGLSRLDVLGLVTISSVSLIAARIFMRRRIS